MKLKYLKELDGIRGIAALMVMCFHFWKEADAWAWVNKIAIFGQTGVTLFFVLSGFLIGRILMNTKTDQAYFRNFYIRRTLRIFPLYFLFLGIFYFFMSYFPNMKEWAYPQYYYFLFLQNIAMTFNWNNFGPSHYWSLAVEEHFYLFLPFLVYFLSYKKLKWVLLSLIGFAFATRIYLLTNGFMVYYFTLTTMDALILGVFLAILERDRGIDKKDQKRFFILFISSSITTLFLWFMINGQSIVWVQVFKFFLIALIYFSLIGLSISVNEKNLFKRCLVSAPLQFAGKISFGLYIYHPLAFSIVQNFQWTDKILVSAFLSFGFVFIIASLSYYLFEFQILKLKQYFEYQKVRAVFFN